MATIPVVERLRQDHEFKASQIYIVGSCLKKKKKNPRKIGTMA